MLLREMMTSSVQESPGHNLRDQGGCTHEHLRILLDEMSQSFYSMHEFAASDGPKRDLSALMPARLTVFAKPDGGVRGIAVHIEAVGGRNLCQPIMKDSQCAPLPMCAVVGASTDADHGLTILSVDGIGAYDHVLRAAILTRLGMMPEACKSCLSSDCLAQDFHRTRGSKGDVNQAEGGEQCSRSGSTARWKLSLGNCLMGNICLRPFCGHSSSPGQDEGVELGRQRSRERCTAQGNADK